MSSKKRKSSSIRITIFWAAIAFLVCIILFIKFGYWIFPPTPPERVIPKTVSIYFSSGEGQVLMAEKRIIEQVDIEGKVENILLELLKGPEGDLVQPVPRGTRLLQVYVKEGVAFIDFSNEIAENHPGGSSGELQTIYAIVNSVTLNLRDIKAVQLLIEGKKKSTLAGHIKIDLPLTPDENLIGN